MDEDGEGDDNLHLKKSKKLQPAVFDVWIVAVSSLLFSDTAAGGGNLIFHVLTTLDVEPAKGWTSTPTETVHWISAACC